jgi:hypothetical protein
MKKLIMPGILTLSLMMGGVALAHHSTVPPESHQGCDVNDNDADMCTPSPSASPSLSPSVSPSPSPTPVLSGEPSPTPPFQTLPDVGGHGIVRP